MTKAQRDHILLRTDLKARLLLDFFMLSTLLNGVVCSYSQSNEMKVSSEDRRIDNPEQVYRVRNYNDTIYNGNVLVTVGFDKMLHWVFDKEVEKGDRSCSGKRTGRFFFFPKFKGERFAGHRKRLQFALLPIMYKMGVITTLLTGLTILVLKGLTIGVILLIFAFGNHFTKWHKSPHHNSQPIHVHVHADDVHKKVTSYPIHSLGPWDRGAEDTNPYYQDSDIESYQRRLLQNFAKMMKFKPLQQ